MLLHLRSAVADYLPQGSPICTFGVGHAPKVLWGYKRQFAVCKSALCAFVPAVCLPFRNNLSFAVCSPVKKQSTQAPDSRHIDVVLPSCLFTLFKGRQTENPQNP